MYLLGDIGNSETKLCLVSKQNKILKKIIFSTKDVNQKKLEINFKNLKPLIHNYIYYYHFSFNILKNK